MKRSYIRKRSKKKIEQDEIYHKLRKEFLKANPTCQVCKSRKATEVHHKAGRGSKTNDVSLWVSVDRTCHTLIHFGANQGYGPSWARKNGFLI